MPDVVVIGGGHNGLVCAAYLAKAGLSVTVVERRHVLGGAAVTEEVFPGFKYSVCSYAVSLLRPEIIRELEPGAARADAAAARRHVHAAARRLSLAARRSARRSTPRSPGTRDATPTPTRTSPRRWCAMAAFAKPLLGMMPPDPNAIDLRGLLDAAGLGRAFRQLGARRQHLLIQLLSSSALDFVERWFESDPLKATLASSGIIGTFLGIRSPGTAYVLLHHYMGEIDGAFRSWGLPRGGTGAVSMAIAAAATRGGRGAADVLARGADPGRRRDRGRRRARVRRGDPRQGGGLERRPAGHVRAPRRPRPAAGRVRRAGPRLPLPRRDRQGESRPRRACRTSRCRPGSGPHLAGAISISPSTDVSRAGLRRRQVRRAVARGRTWTS